MWRCHRAGTAACVSLIWTQNRPRHSRSRGAQLPASLGGRVEVSRRVVPAGGKPSSPAALGGAPAWPQGLEPPGECSHPTDMWG